MNVGKCKFYNHKLKVLIYSFLLVIVAFSIAFSKKINNEFYRDETLHNYKLNSNFPLPNVNTTSLMSDTNLFVYLDDEEYGIYSKSVYDYLIENDYFYVGTYKKDGLIAEILPRHVYQPIDNKYNFSDSAHKFIYSPSDKLNINSGESIIDTCFEITIERVKDKRYVFYKNEMYNTIIRLGEKTSIQVLDESRDNS